MRCWLASQQSRQSVILSSVDVGFAVWLALTTGIWAEVTVYQFQRASVLLPAPLALSATHHRKNVPQVATGARMRDVEKNGMQPRACSRAAPDGLQSCECEIGDCCSKPLRFLSVCYPARLSRNLLNTMCSNSKDEHSVNCRACGSRHPASCCLERLLKSLLFPRAWRTKSTLLGPAVKALLTWTATSSPISSPSSSLYLPSILATLKPYVCSYPIPSTSPNWAPNILKTTNPVPLIPPLSEDRLSERAEAQRCFLTLTLPLTLGPCPSILLC